MNNIKVGRVDLIDKLQQNRDKHRGIFLEAQESYRKAVIAELDSMLKDARDGRKIRRHITLIEPQDHTRDYDRVIGMLSMSINDTIELDEHDYQSYVQDEWNWKRQFLAANSSYSQTAMIDYISAQEES